LYAAAGYIVVYGNPRGSTSYGEEFANTIYNNYPSQDYDDLMSIVDTAIQKGNVDADNLFVTGSSGGGVLTSWIVGQDASIQSSSDPAAGDQLDQLVAHHRHVGLRRALLVQENALGRSGDVLEALTAFFGGNVTTRPWCWWVLNDLRTTVGEAEQYYHALQFKHVPTAMYYIPGEPHVLQRPSHLAAQSFGDH